MIKLHQKSEEFLKDVFKIYEDCGSPKAFLTGKFILHLYAEDDTYDEAGNTQGYYDSLFFRLDIYDIENKKKYSIGSRDGISILGNVKFDIRIFKDGSTCIFTREEVEIEFWQNVEVRAKGYLQSLHEFLNIAK